MGPVENWLECELRQKGTLPVLVLIPQAPSCRLSRRCVERIVLAWNDLDSDPAAAADDIVKMLHHPYYADETSETHKEMLAFVKHWLSQLGEEHDEVLSRSKLKASMYSTCNMDLTALVFK